MTKLSATQRLILSAAAPRADRIALPLPPNLRGGAAARVVGALIAKGLIEEVDARRGDPVWRKTGNGHGTTLIATDAGLAAIGIEPENKAQQPVDGKVRAPREGTKQAKLIAMLRAPEGATVDELAVVTGWRAHTIRGAMSGALKKKLNLEVISKKVEGRGRVYSISQ